MEPFTEKQESSEKNTTTKKQQLPIFQHLNGQIHFQNCNQMKKQKFQDQQTLRTQSTGNLSQFYYSMDSSYSLHSHFSSADKIQYSKTQKDEILTSEDSPQFNKIRPKDQSQCPLIEPRKIDFVNTDEHTSQGNFMKNKNSIDLRELKITMKSNQKILKEESSEKQSESGDIKSYTSCLHQIVDQNHLESPSKQVKGNQQQKQTEISQPGSIQEQSFQMSKYTLQKAFKNVSTQKQQIDRERLLIRPIEVVQNKPETQNQQSKLESPIKQKNKKQMRQQLEIRKIPSNLYESYDELLLSVNNNQKALGKDYIISPIKLKEKSNPAPMNKKKSKESDKFDDSPKLKNQRPDKIKTNLKKTTLDEELLVSLPIVEGYCQLKTDNSQVYQTKFFINKNTIFFQTFKQILISAVTKIKFIQKDEKQITVKITYEPEPNAKPQNFLIQLLTETSETYFFQSYEFFSQIVLRKLLLMKIAINQLIERYEIESPGKSPQSSPLSSPLSLPSILPRKPSQNVEIEGPTLLQSNLYKKSTFFNSWQKKYFTLNSKYLQSYSCSPINGQKQKSSTQLSKTSEIWTRFELIYGYLVIKMWHSKIQKFQIGIPLCDFTNPEGKNNWLYGLSKNLVWRKNLVKEEKSKLTVET